VHLDVSVLDRYRRPVRGLTPSDFTILDDGKPQQIAVFQAVEIAEPEQPSAPWMRDVVRDVHTNDRIQERRLFLIILDDATIQSDLHALKNVREIARTVMDRLGPSDLAAAIFTRDNRHSQDYTNDRARLLAAVDRFTVGFRDMGLFDAEKPSTRRRDGRSLLHVLGERAAGRRRAADQHARPPQSDPLHRARSAS
jgi:VWFA-related protein